MDTDEKPAEDDHAYFITRGTELCDVSDGVCKSILFPVLNYGDMYAYFIF